MNWTKGYEKALIDILDKKQQAINLGLKCDDVVNFISGEMKVMVNNSIKTYEKLKDQIYKEK